MYTYIVSLDYSEYLVYYKAKEKRKQQIAPSLLRLLDFRLKIIPGYFKTVKGKDPCTRDYCG